MVGILTLLTSLCGSPERSAPGCDSDGVKLNGNGAAILSIGNDPMESQDHITGARARKVPRTVGTNYSILVSK